MGNGHRRRKHKTPKHNVPLCDLSFLSYGPEDSFEFLKLNLGASPKHVLDWNWGVPNGSECSSSNTCNPYSAEHPHRLEVPASMKNALTAGSIILVPMLSCIHQMYDVARWNVDVGNRGGKRRNIFEVIPSNQPHPYLILPVDASRLPRDLFVHQANGRKKSYNLHTYDNVPIVESTAHPVHVLYHAYLSNWILQFECLPAMKYLSAVETMANAVCKLWETSPSFLGPTWPVRLGSFPTLTTSPLSLWSFSPPSSDLGLPDDDTVCPCTTASGCSRQSTSSLASVPHEVVRSRIEMWIRTISDNHPLPPPLPLLEPVHSHVDDDEPSVYVSKWAYDDYKSLDGAKDDRSKWTSNDWAKFRFGERIWR